MSIKGPITTVLLFSLAVSAYGSTPCKLPPSVPKLDKCICNKEADFQNKAVLKCDDITTDELQRVFGHLAYTGDSFYELEVTNSDLNNLQELPEHMQLIKILKLVDVTGLSGNDLKSLLHNLDDLEELILDEAANLEQITSELFGNKMQLKSLSLNRNNIQHVNENTFEYLPHLTHLSLEDNQLKSIPDSSIKVPNLHLKLNGNPITHVTDEATAIIEDKDIRLSVDAIQCNCETKDTAFVKYVREAQLETVRCKMEDHPEGRLLKHLTEKEFCNGSATPILSLFLLIVTLFTTLL